MRWLLTNAVPEFEAALAAIGETVVSTAAHHQTAGRDGEWLREAIEATAETRPAGVHPVTWALKTGGIDDDDANPTLYPLRRHLNDLRPDALVLTPLLQHKGGAAARAHVNRWRNAVGRGGVVVGLALHDPETLQSASRGWRRCSVQLVDIGVYVTHDEASAARSAPERRTALWRPGLSAAPVVAAVQHAMTRNFQADRRNQPFR